jgi:hypothetical protein
MTKKTPKNIQYFDAVRNWRRIARHLDNVILQRVLVSNFNKYTFGRWHKPFRLGQYPHEFESCDWYLDRKGRPPRYWLYVKHAACHWLVNFNLMLATLVEPKRAWRIITSDSHSSVWDGDETLFDLNFLALQVPPQVCFKSAYDEELAPGEFMDIGYAEHYKVEQSRIKRAA